MSIRLFQLVHSSTIPSGSTKAVVLALADCANENDYVPTVTIKYLSGNSGYCQRSVAEALKYLKSAGVVSVVKRTPYGASYLIHTQNIVKRDKQTVEHTPDCISDQSEICKNCISDQPVPTNVSTDMQKLHISGGYDTKNQLDFDGVFNGDETALLLDRILEGIGKNSDAEKIAAVLDRILEGLSDDQKTHIYSIKLYLYYLTIYILYTKSIIDLDNTNVLSSSFAKQVFANHSAPKNQVDGEEATQPSLLPLPELTVSESTSPVAEPLPSIIPSPIQKSSPRRPAVSNDAPSSTDTKKTNKKNDYTNVMIRAFTHNINGEVRYATPSFKTKADLHLNLHTWVQPLWEIYGYYTQLPEFEGAKQYDERILERACGLIHAAVSHANKSNMTVNTPKSILWAARQLWASKYGAKEDGTTPATKQESGALVLNG